MNAGMPPTPVSPTRTKRLGLMKIRIGSDHIIKGSDGVERQFRVKDKSRLPKVKCVALCLTCKKMWDSETDLIEAHPEERILHKQLEVHPYGWWSDEPADKDPKNKDPGRVVGLLSDAD